MGYTVRVVRNDFIAFRMFGTVSIQDCMALAAQLDTLNRSAAPSPMMLADVSDVEQYPLKLREFRKVWTDTPMPIGRFAVVTHNKLLYFLAASVTMLFAPHVQMRPFTTREAALGYLNARTPDLPPLTVESLRPIYPVFIETSAGQREAAHTLPDTRPLLDTKPLPDTKPLAPRRVPQLVIQGAESSSGD